MSYTIYIYIHICTHTHTQDARFRGLFLCVPSGVLASGSCSLDAALAISRKLATLDLQNLGFFGVLYFTILFVGWGFLL